ncbi:MAG: hypothetical protein HOP15_14525 [Planctomycetes bacterium]|nr:hypothetical protein [Planctomycetota bacterium]
MSPSAESRDALSRARFFLERAKASDGDLEAFEAFLEACIVFARSALQRDHERFKATKSQGVKDWFDSLDENASVLFFRKHRDLIIHEKPAELGQVIHVHSIAPTSVVGGSGGIPTDTAPRPARALESYYLTEPGTPATTEVEQHLQVLESVLHEARKRFDSR